jgi:hypothetical protein
VTEARPIRIARASPPAPASGARGPVPPGARGAPAATRIENTAAMRWAMRLGLLYALAVMVGYYLFLVLGEAAPGGRTAAGLDDLAALGILAAVIAAVGFVVILRGAPRAFEAGDDGWTVLERFGGPRRFPASPDLTIRRRRTFRGGLAPAPIVSVQIGSGPRVRTYWIDESLLAAVLPPDV